MVLSSCRSMGVALLCVALASCSSTPAQLEQKAEATVRTFTENYQEIYRRVSSSARRCMAGNINAYASYAVDSDLFPDLGYGETTFSLINLGVRNYYLSAKVQRAGSGASLTIRAGNTVDGGTVLTEKVLRWAGGDEAC